MWPKQNGGTVPGGGELGENGARAQLEASTKPKARRRGGKGSSGNGRRRGHAGLETREVTVPGDAEGGFRLDVHFPRGF